MSIAKSYFPENYNINFEMWSATNVLSTLKVKILNSLIPAQYKGTIMVTSLCDVHHKYILKTGTCKGLHSLREFYSF